MPSTLSATITMVANTGWLIATRVIHMALARVRGDGLDGPRAALVLQPRGLPMLQVVELGRDDIVVGREAREDLHEMRALIARADRHRPPLEPVARDQPDVALHPFAAYGGDGERRGFALRCDGEAYAGEHACL